MVCILLIFGIVNAYEYENMDLPVSILYLRLVDLIPFGTAKRLLCLARNHRAIYGIIKFAQKLFLISTLV